MTATHAPLSRLRFGDDYPGGSINARKTKSEEGIPEMLASMLAHGQIHALSVKTHENGKVYVGEGNRRLKAFRLGVQQGKIEKNHPVRIEEMPEAADPAELSLAANVMRLPMHEVDQYEAFVALKDAGRSVADIASRFGTSDIMVTRRLALGGLSPHLRNAWREGRINADHAKAFTNSADHELQDQVYAKLAQGLRLQRQDIVRALTRSDVARSGDLAFVGKEAYAAAGGRLHEDLFVEEAHILDPEVLQRLQRQKLLAIGAELEADGWGWTGIDVELPNDHYKWERIRPTVVHTEAELFRLEELKPQLEYPKPITPEGQRATDAARVERNSIVEAALLRSFTPEQKARSGCVLHLRYDGDLRIDWGFVRPGTDLAGPLPAGAAAPEAGDDVEETAPPAQAASEISGALAQTVSEWATIAAANALADEPELALRVLLAALQSYGAPARFSRSGWAGLRDGMKDKAPARDLSFAKALEDTLRTGMPHLKAALAAEVARSLDLTAAAAHHPAYAVKEGASLIDALDAEGYLGAARHAFDPAVYFDRAPAAVAIAAVDEMGGKKPTGKKGNIALAAADLARDLGWLPAGMRSSAYVPPRVPTPAPAGETVGRGRGRAPAGAPLSV